eukprot:COSAG04_NODE_13789_length_592_cov_0.884381_1_plen_43_part_01
MGENGSIKLYYGAETKYEGEYERAEVGFPSYLAAARGGLGRGW